MEHNSDPQIPAIPSQRGDGIGDTPAYLCGMLLALSLYQALTWLYEYLF